MCHGRWSYRYRDRALQILLSRFLCELSLASVWNLNRVDQRTPANLQLSLARRPFYMTICFWDILWGRRTEFCADDVRTVYRWSWQCGHTVTTTITQWIVSCPIQRLSVHGSGHLFQLHVRSFGCFFGSMGLSMSSGKLSLSLSRQDSLLATPLIYDLILLTELCSRIQVQTVDEQDDSTLDSVVDNDDDKNTTAWEPFHPVLSLLSYMLKAPMVPPSAPVVNALFPQREAITNVLKACLGLPPENYMTLQHKFASSLQQQHDETMRRRQQTQEEEQEKQTSANGVSHTTTNGVMPTSNGHATRNGTGYQNGTH